MNAGRKITCAATVMLVLAAGNVRADWDLGDPAKWVQMPDLSTLGIDVNAYADVDPIELYPKLLILADDFECTSTDPITDIHIWGSWKHDVLPTRFEPVDPFIFPDPSQVEFRLSIHADVKAGEDPEMPWSHPGELLWERPFLPGEFTVREYATNLVEGWLDPLSGNYELPGDSICYQYNFFINEAEAFLQEGTTTNPVVYWLDVSAHQVGIGGTSEEPIFGWKTSVDHWNDDAVYGPTDPANWPFADRWVELIHPLTGESLDMAFVITPEPVTLGLVTLGAFGLLIGRRRR